MLLLLLLLLLQLLLLLLLLLLSVLLLLFDDVYHETGYGHCCVLACAAVKTVLAICSGVARFDCTYIQITDAASKLVVAKAPERD